MIISDVTIDDLKNYAHVYHNEDDSLFTNILLASRSYIQGYTGLTYDEMDAKEDLTMVLMVLSNELYDQRTFLMENAKINPMIETILNMYSKNLL
jgi:uncharacterized phage protein (predicted DNA packaging)